MRVVTRTVVSAFLKGKEKRVGNTSTDGEYLYLYGNIIAQKTDSGIYVKDGGWQTCTTKDRINGVISLLSSFGYTPLVRCLYSINYVWYMGNGENLIERIPFENGFKVGFKAV